MIFSVLMLVAVPQDCDNPVTQIEMTMCAGAAFEQADAEMNRVWKQTYAEMKRRDAAGERDLPPPGYADALLASQRAWIAYRDAQCVTEGQAMRGGSGQPMVEALCKARLTDERTQFLREIVEND